MLAKKGSSLLKIWYVLSNYKLECTHSVLICNCCVVSYVFVCLLHHFSQFWRNLCCEHIRIDRGFISLKNTRTAELYVWNAIGASLNQGWHNHLCDHLFGENRHDSGKWLESAHSIIEALLVNIVTVYNLWDEACNNPVSTKCCRELSRFSYTHITHWSSRVCQVLEVDCFKASSENIKAESYWQFSD